MSGFVTAAQYAIVTTDLHRPAAFVGVLASGQGAGSILGGLMVGRLLDRHGQLAVGAAGAVLFAVGAAARCVPWLPAVVGSSVVTGLGLPWTLVAAMTAIQLRTPEDLLGRVAASANSLLFAPVAFATPIGAGVILLDRRLPLIVAAAVCLIAALLPKVQAHTHSRRTATGADPDGASSSADEGLRDVRA